MLTILFNIIIYPIKLLIECIFAILSVSIFKENIGISIVGLSLAVNILCLPLYAKAEHLQDFERNIQKKMARRIESIKRCFKGDERYMVLSMYYRENNYHPIMALRSSLSLLLQIPFFIAAYSFLSHLDVLKGKSLSIINDLSTPDALLTIAHSSINLLPVIMTIINIIAGIIYSRGFPKKEKIQLYVMSLLFLLLLYNSPSALVLYWTMNNVFSLVKNILFKIKNPLKIVYFLGLLLFAVFMIYVLFFRYNNPKRAFRNQAFSVALFVFFAGIPIYVRAVKYAANRWLSFFFVNTKYINHIFLFSCISLWVLAGCFIPFNLVASDPAQFISIGNITSPFSLLAFPAIQAIGLFLFWPVYLFALFSKKIKPFFSLLITTIAFCGYINFFVFNGNYGIVSQTLAYSLRDGFYLADTVSRQVINVLVCFAIMLVTGVTIFLKKTKLLLFLLGLCTAGSLSLCITKAVQIQSFINHNVELQQKITQNSTQSDPHDFAPVFTLSKTEKNVFVLMLDGAINSYFPLIIEEIPGLKESFNEFIYYPNTASFYGRTIFGTPPIFGGYEYTTYNMNKRTDIKMKDKHNEALLLLPELFKQNGFDVTLTDMPYVDYGETSDSEFYRQRGITGLRIDGLYGDKYIREVLKLDAYIEPLQTAQLLQRNILMYSMLHISIYTLRDIIYQNGNYWSMADYSLDAGVSLGTLNSYAELYYLPQLTEIKDGEKGQLSIMVNNLTHDPAYLQYPDYAVEERITQQGNNFFGNKSFKYYHVNAASYILLAKWFDYLHSEGVWNNTRIIIVSDHGDGGITHPDFSSFQNNHVLPYNPILLVKDFAENDEFTINTDFMTNADVPLLALKDIVENPVNPFTGKVLGPEKDKGIYIFTGGYTNTSFYSGTICLDDNSGFYYIHDSIFEQENWQELKYKDFKER
jgi:YidC/Oxa1 family membrane protein insertase